MPRTAVSAPENATEGLVVTILGKADQFQRNFNTSTSKWYWTMYRRLDSLNQFPNDTKQLSNSFTRSSPANDRTRVGPCAAQPTFLNHHGQTRLTAWGLVKV